MHLTLETKEHKQIDWDKQNLLTTSDGTLIINLPDSPHDATSFTGILLKPKMQYYEGLLKAELKLANQVYTFTLQN